MTTEAQPRHEVGGAGTLDRLRAISEVVDQGQVPLSVFAEPWVYELELREIFGKSWLFIGLESEIPQPGDYALRYMGEDPFIFVRGEDDVVRVLFDSCRHRGTTVCTAERGNSSHFRCPYHGWTYKNTGALVGMPSRQNAYRSLDVSQWGLVAAPRVASYHGLVFASLAPSGPSLEEFLGDFRWYLDMQVALTPGGMKVVGVPHRWRIKCNWKSGPDNFAGDSYHTQMLHRSAVEIGLYSNVVAGPAGRRGSNDVHVADCDGHSTSIRRADVDSSQFWAYPKEVIELIEQSDLDAAQLDIVRRSMSHVGNIFPNLSFIHATGTNDPSKPPSCWFSLRQWQPVGVGEMEAWSWILAPAEADDDFIRRAGEVGTGMLSPSGNVEPDDTAVWVSIARASRGGFASSANLLLNYQMGMSGMGDASVLPDWPGPGVAYDTNLEEGVQRTFYNQWCAALMNSVGASGR